MSVPQFGEFFVSLRLQTNCHGFLSLQAGLSPRSASCSTPAHAASCLSFAVALNTAFPFSPLRSVLINSCSQKKMEKLTVKKLIDQLSIYDEDTEVFFGNTEGALRFNEMRIRGENLLQICFSETITRNEQGELIVEDFPH